MLIGCLDGRVHKWEVGGATKDLLHLEGSVLHMQFDHQLKVSTRAYIHTTLAYILKSTFPCYSYWQWGHQREY